MNNTPTVPLSKVIVSLFYLLVLPAMLFLFAGDWRWIEGWVYSAIFLLMSYGILVYLYFHDPALLNERFKSPGPRTGAIFDRHDRGACFRRRSDAQTGARGL